MPWVNCEWCGKPIHRKSNRLKRCKHHFCSLKCRADWQRANVLGLDLLKRLALNERPREFSYLLGVLCGDGGLTHYCFRWRGKTISQYLFFLKSKDLEFACSVLGALKALGLNPRLRREGKYYKVEVTSKALYLLLKEARENLEEYTLSPVDFLRGFYESEGNLQISRRKDRDSPSIRIRIVNTSRALLEFIQKLLRGLGIESSIRLHYKARGRVEKGKEIVERDCYVLDIHGGGRVVRFLELVRPCIYRKGLPFLLEGLKKYKLKRRLHVRVAPDVVSDNRGNEV